MNFAEKVDSLPIQIKDLLTSNEVRLSLEKTCFLYGAGEELIEALAGPIGLIFINEVKLADLPRIIFQNCKAAESIIYGIAYEINNRIFNKFPDYFKNSPALLEQWTQLKSAPLISEDEAWKKVLHLEPWILEEEQEKKKAEMEARAELQKQQANLEQRTLSDAMRIYPELGEQLITSEKIMLKTFPEPVRPSIKNWLADYTFNLGFNTHSSIERNNYLFHEKNTERLSVSDREKLSYILKSHDENTAITVNKTLKQVIFLIAKPAPAKTNKPQPLSAGRPVQNPVPPAPLRQNLNEINRPIENKPQIQNSPIAPQPVRRNEFDSQRENSTPATTRTPDLKPNFNSSQQNSSSLHNTVSFSSPQKLPYEKISAPQPSVPTPPIVNQAPARESQPKIERFNPANPSLYTIRPVYRHEDKTPEPPRALPKNVVNLKEF